jgi:hypothetical protein
MFVHYSKTKAEFISAGLATQYTNHIVFIKGDANGNGSCIYTHGMYFANFAEFISAVNYVKGISVGGQSYNAAAGGGYVAFGAKDPSTVAVNAGSNGIEIGLTDAFVAKVNDTATNLGSKSDTADKDGSAFARIANLAALVSDLTGGSTDSIEGQIASAINGLRTEIVGTLDTADAKTLAAINDELDSVYSVLGGIKVNGKNLVSNGVAQEVTLTGSDISNGNGKTITEAIKANSDAIGVLNGNNTVDGSVDKKIKDAIEAFAGSADADNVIENVTELLNYVSGVDGSKDLATAIAQIEENKGKIETLNGNNATTGSVAKQVKDAIDAEVERANGAYATAEQGAKADTAYQKPEGGIVNDDIADGTIELAKLADEAYYLIESKVFYSEIKAGDANGQIKVKDTNINVTGLKSAAYTEASAYATAAQGEKADSAYQKPSTGIPSTDFAQAVKTSLGKADTAYQLPTGGVPKTDLASGVQTSLGKADTAYQKASTGIPKSDLASTVQTSLTNADTAFNNRIIGTDVNSNYVGEGVADYIEIKDNKIVYVLGTVDKGSVEEGLATSTDVKTYVDSLWEWEEL